MNRVIAYIDGYNFFHALNDLGWSRFLWLDYQNLCQRLLKFNQELVMTKYFTARTTGSHSKRIRQTTYIEALQTLNYFEVIEGRFQDEPEKCPKCGFEYTTPKEKKTDVSIGVNMIYDAFVNRFDIAMLLSADADLVPAIELIKSKDEFQTKRVVVALPPGRNSDELKSITSCFPIGRSHLAQSLLPNRIKRDDGFILERPIEWS